MINYDVLIINIMYKLLKNKLTCNKHIQKGTKVEVM